MSVEMASSWSTPWAALHGSTWANFSTFSLKLQRSFWWTEVIPSRAKSSELPEECADSEQMAREFSRSSCLVNPWQRRVKPGKFSHIAPAHGWCDCHPFCCPDWKDQPRQSRIAVARLQRAGQFGFFFDSCAERMLVKIVFAFPFVPNFSFSSF